MSGGPHVSGGQRSERGRPDGGTEGAGDGSGTGTDVRSPEIGAGPAAAVPPGAPAGTPSLDGRSPQAGAPASGGLHADAVRVLSSWDAPDAAQERTRLEFLRHLEEHPADGMWRECAAGHITASTAVLDASRTRVLLTLHAKVKAWLQLGGHCERDDAALADAALREATEESGIGGLRLLPVPVQLDRHSVRCDGRDSRHLDVQYVAIAPERARHRVSDESDDLRWFPVGDLPEPTDDAVRTLVARAVALTG